MPTQHPSHEFDADDRKVYRDWLRKTVVAYVAFGSVLRRCRRTSDNDASCGESIRPEGCRLIWQRATRSRRPNARARLGGRLVQPPRCLG